MESLIQRYVTPEKPDPIAHVIDTPTAPWADESAQNQTIAASRTDFDESTKTSRISSPASETYPLSDASAENVPLTHDNSAIPDSSLTAEDPLQVFIVGGARMGTSVMLRAMQEVFCLPAHGESHVIPGFAHIVFQLNRHYDRFRGSSEDVLIKELKIDELEGVLFEHARGLYKATYGGSRWADKTPSDEAVHSLPLIYRIFPEARVILMRRNGIEVVDSYRKKFSSTFEEACRTWTSVMLGIREVRGTCRGMLEIDQFELANNTEEVSAKISAFLGQSERSEALARFLKSNLEDRQSTHDWGRRLGLAEVDWTGEEKARFIQVCGTSMREFGYAL